MPGSTPEGYQQPIAAPQVLAAMDAVLLILLSRRVASDLCVGTRSVLVPQETTLGKQGLRGSIAVERFRPVEGSQGAEG